MSFIGLRIWVTWVMTLETGALPAMCRTSVLAMALALSALSEIVHSELAMNTPLLVTVTTVCRLLWSFLP